MTRRIVTFSGAAYDATTAAIVDANVRGWADAVHVFDDQWLRAHEFYSVNRWLWEHPGQRFADGSYARRGCGWYAWKPLVMIEAFRCFARTGDPVLYVDADTVPIADLAPIWTTAERDGAMFFKAQGHRQGTWCTRDCRAVMGDDGAMLKVQKAAALGRGPCPPAAFDTRQHAVARFFAMRAGSWRNMQFLAEWLTFAAHPLATTFDPSELGPESDGFQEHRTEQAIMTSLCHRYGFRLFRECDDGGEGWAEDRALFGQLFEQRRIGDGSDPSGSRWRNV